MYIQIGTYDGPIRPLVEQAYSLVPGASREGYCTVHDFSVGTQYAPIFQQIIPGHWVRSFLSIIWHNGTIPPHIDTDMREDAIRSHVVLDTNAECWYLHDGQWQQLQTGGVYRMDPLKIHASVNWGHGARIHLVVDTN